MSKKRINAYVLLLIVSIIWGAASPVVKYALNWFHPVIFLTYRFLISTIVAAIVFGFTPVKLPKKSRDISLAFITMLLSTPLALGLFFLGLSKTSALSGSLITAGAPILLVAAGAIFLHERVSTTEKIGILITIIGTFVIAIGPLIFNNTPNHLGTLEGNVVMILATLADLAAALFTKISMDRGISQRLLAHGQFILGLFVFIPILLFRHSIGSITETILTAPIQAHLSVWFMALLSGSLAYSLRNEGLKWVEVSEAAIFTYLQPIWSAILAVLWLGEPMTTSYVVGGLVLAAGVAISEYQGSRSKRRHASPRRQKKR